MLWFSDKTLDHNEFGYTNDNESLEILRTVIHVLIFQGNGEICVRTTTNPYEGIRNSLELP